MVRHSLRKYEGRELGAPDKLVGANCQVPEGVIALDPSISPEGIAIEAMGSIHVQRVYTPSDRGIKLTARSDDEKEVDISCFPYTKIWGKLMLLTGMTRPDAPGSARELKRRTSPPCL